MKLNLKKIIIDQKESLDAILKEDHLIEREVLPFFRSFLNSSLIKVITGPRRSGKSILCYQLLKGNQFAYINFDDESLGHIAASDLNDVLEVFYELYDHPQFVFLDEIQNIHGWELFVNRLHRLKMNIVLTGSNAHLLSQELSTHLTGRHYSLELYPFSFKEFLMYKNITYSQKEPLSTKTIANIKGMLDEYMRIGGFPECLKEKDYRRYLLSLYSSIITKDIAIRHNVRFISSLKEIALYLLSNISSPITFNKLKNFFQIKSVHTVKNYVTFLEESYLIFMLERFSFKMKERLSAPRKVYAVDIGLAQAVGVTHTPNYGPLYENIVAIELFRRKSLDLDVEIYYWQDYSQKEVDFLIKKGTKFLQLIQVCYNLNSYETKKREITSLLRAAKELKCRELLIITASYESEEKEEKYLLKYTPLWKWLLT